MIFKEIYKKASFYPDKALKKLIDSKNVYIRTIFPYSLFVSMNFLLYSIGISGIILAFLIDILVGIILLKQNYDRNRIIEVIEIIKNDNVKAKVNTSKLHFDNIPLADAVNSIGDGIEKAVDKSMRDEKLKTELITNVSHDLKTPLTSIINYVGLIKRENIDNEKINGYIEVLDNKANKLKHLTEDLVEASKISSGNVSVSLSKINFVEMVNQTIGEFYEKFETSGLIPYFSSEESKMMIMADPGHLWRVIENLFGNICKYALEGTIVYMDMNYVYENSCKKIVYCVNNISKSELTVDEETLSERFIRGDKSRTTEGSGLGLSIAKSLTTLQGGEFKIRTTGNVFKAILSFDAE
ncbi:sensor histidine kinase [Butyrivibrio sp. YAB3001]|uniref:sensor histidine kinase n=1 Tax=Butyrivibrio sp. YAB3001 TaxID=1520812 RepID=UPI0008F66B62|nr:HAMP domain-containing sensor histidine kinase [Butyrivibrio sp. YAB3001]SFB68540.1 Signal transduction histidine kinase [Butyrivibrio sp. YAB3001]